MTAPATMNQYVGRYLHEREALGFRGRSEGYALVSFANYIDSAGHRGPLKVETMADWARLDKHGSTDPKTWARRLKKLRTFLRWLRQYEPQTEVPDDSIFGSIDQRQAPHIYTEQEIIDLLCVARRLQPDLRGATYETLYGLIACTGLRVSEALRLRIENVDLQQDMLTIRQTKFAKSRHVPLHETTGDALRRYRHLRDQHAEACPESPFFVATRGRRLGKPLSDKQVHSVFRDIRERLKWENRGAHHAPRIHDLRHTFAVRRILLWCEQGIDVDQAMLSLTTYLGHAMVTNTYWYLSAVPELLSLAAARSESGMSRDNSHG